MARSRVDMDDDTPLSGEEVAKDRQSIAKALEVARQIRPSVVEGWRARTQHLAGSVSPSSDLLVQPPREERGIEVGEHDFGAKLRFERCHCQEVVSLNEPKLRGPSRNADQAPLRPARSFAILADPRKPNAFPIDRDRYRSTLGSFHAANRALSDGAGSTFRLPDLGQRSGR